MSDNQKDRLALLRILGAGASNAGDVERLLEALQLLKKPQLEDIWFNHEASISYWLLIINGVDNKIETKMANEILFWKEFHAGGDANVRCVQSSDRELYKLCASSFSVVSPPSLIFSTDARFEQAIKVDSQLLHELIKENNSLRSFVGKVHSLIYNGHSIEDIRKQLLKESFWKGVKIVYQEMKSLISITLGT